MKIIDKDPVEIFVIECFKILGFNNLADRWTRKSPPFAILTAKISKILALASFISVSSDSFIHYIPEDMTNIKQIIMFLGGLNAAIVFIANSTVDSKQQ